MADYSLFANIWRGAETINSREIFEKVRKEISNGKIVMLFLDEMQGIGQRDKSPGNKCSNETLEQLLVETSRFDHSKCILIAASAQEPSTFDQQILRRGRFGKTIFCDNPNEDEIVDIIQKRMNKLASLSSYQPFSEEGIDYNALAKRMNGFTLSDIYHLVSDVAYRKVEEVRRGEKFRPFRTEDFDKLTELANERKKRIIGKVSS
jgi:SpoVK/Ycf46/Vps4 family AAA+-type ATPase